MNTKKIEEAELMTFCIDEARIHIKTLPLGSFIESKEAVPEELFEFLSKLKLMNRFGKALSKAVKIGEVNLVRGTGAEALTDDRHNQYIVIHK